MSVAGFRPGFGRGGTTHSLLVKDAWQGGVSAIGEAAEVGVIDGLIGAADSRGAAESAGVRVGGEAAVSCGFIAIVVVTPLARSDSYTNIDVLYQINTRSDWWCVIDLDFFVEESSPGERIAGQSVQYTRSWA